ncbi:twin-arginine translocation signal domain-containing protein [Brevibacillus sp. HD3.3A]|nr:twin-arginine translocation signal domain-containing protein [Brevibacillus sp. HD3.3A]
MARVFKDAIHLKKSRRDVLAKTGVGAGTGAALHFLQIEAHMVHL